MTSLEEVHKLLLELQKEQQASNAKIDSLLDEIKVKNSKIEILEAKVEELEGNIAVLSNTTKLLEIKCDDNEQYSRRMSLRINNLSGSDKETAEESINLVVETLNNSGIEIKKADINRAHRIGRPNSKYPRQMIVKFRYWDTRASVYKKRKNLKDQKIFVDLTKRRMELRKMANEKIKDIHGAEYVFADINCSLCVKLIGDKGFKYFNTEYELVKILSSP